MSKLQEFKAFPIHRFESSGVERFNSPRRRVLRATHIILVWDKNNIISKEVCVSVQRSTLKFNVSVEFRVVSSVTVMWFMSHLFVVKFQCLIFFPWSSPVYIFPITSWSPSIISISKCPNHLAVHTSSSTSLCPLDTSREPVNNEPLLLSASFTSRSFFKERRRCRRRRGTVPVFSIANPLLASFHGKESWSMRKNWKSKQPFMCSHNVSLSFVFEHSSSRSLMLLPRIYRKKTLNPPNAPDPANHQVLVSENLFIDVSRTTCRRSQIQYSALGLLEASWPCRWVFCVNIRRH